MFKSSNIWLTRSLSLSLKNLNCHVLKWQAKKKFTLLIIKEMLISEFLQIHKVLPCLKKRQYTQKKGKTWQKKGCVTSNLLVSYTFLAFSDNFMKVLIFKKGRKKTLGSGTGPNIRLKDALRHDSNRTQYKAKRCLDTWFKHDPIQGQKMPGYMIQTGPNIRSKDAWIHDSNRTQYKAKRCPDTWFKQDPI